MSRLGYVRVVRALTILCHKVWGCGWYCVLW